MYATNGSNFNIDPDFKFNKYMKDKYENTEKFMNEKMQAEEVEEFLRIEQKGITSIENIASKA